MLVRPLMAALVVLLTTPAAIAVDHVKHMVHVHYDPTTKGLVFKTPDGKQPESIILALNDVVRITLTQAWPSTIEIARWEGTETWKEEKKDGKDTIITTFYQKQQKTVYGYIGDQIRITAAFSAEAAENFEVKPGKLPERTVGKANAGLAFEGKISAPQQPAMTPRGAWHVKPHQILYPTQSQHWFTITITVQR